MEYSQELGQEKKFSDLSTGSVFGESRYQKQKEESLTIQSYFVGSSIDNKSQQLFKTLNKPFSLAKVATTTKPSINVMRQKKNYLQQKEQREKSQNIVHFIQPELSINSLIQKNSLMIKINQVKYFSSTKKGLRNFENIQNQDVILVERIANIYKLFAIFDGHGQYGKTVAESSAYLFKKLIKSYQEQFKRELTEKKIVQIVKNCIQKTQAYLHNSKFNEIQYSGTTALIVLVTPISIISFNIGNSRLVIGMKEQNGPNIYDFQVTHDHDLNRLDERLRVTKHGAVISPLKDKLGQNFGPDRLWNKNEKRPGTFITRALGLTCGTKAGIICDPQVSVLTYNKRMKFMIMASDGLWSVQENDQVISYMDRYYRQGQFGMGVSSLMFEATARWKSKNQLMDDISIIGIRLTKQI